MPAAGGCTNCCTKYSLLNREASCSNCPLSFCKKCVSYKTHAPRLGLQPVPVCYGCYQKLEADKVKPVASSNGNWWGEGLPPPSMRQQIGQNSQPKAPPRLVSTRVREEAEKAAARQKETFKQDCAETQELEKRLALLKQKDGEVENTRIATVEELEERMAALRGCDVDLIRNPRLWVQQSGPEIRTGDSVDGLMQQARDQANLEEKYDPDKMLLIRAQRLHDDAAHAPSDADVCPPNEQPEGTDRFSMNTEFTTTTEDELQEIKRLMSDAEKRVNDMDADDKKTEKELHEALVASRQKSLDNEKISKEISGFWDRQINKTIQLEDDDDSDKSLDDECLRRIVREAEQAPDYPEPSSSRPADAPTSTSPKKGLLSKFFKR